MQCFEYYTNIIYISLFFGRRNTTGNELSELDMSDKIDTVPQCGNKKQLREASEQKTAAPNCANSASFAMKISEIIHPRGDLATI